MNRIITGIAAVIIAATVVAGNVGDVIFSANLNGDGIGKATWKFRPNSTREAQFDVEGEDLAPNTDYIVRTAGKVWPVQTDDFGAFDLGLRFRNSLALKIVDGTRVSVVDANGNVAMTGRFARVQ